MGQILIRKIDDAALERLQILAKERGMPLEALARSALEDAAQRRTAAETREWLRKLDEISEMSPPSSTDSTCILRELREGNESDA